MRLYKAQYVAPATITQEEWDEQAAGDFPEPEGWAEHCQEMWGEHREFFPPSDRPIYRSRSSAQARVNLINRWLGPGAAVLVEADVAWTPVEAANARRRRERLDAKLAALDKRRAQVAAERNLAALAEKLHDGTAVVS